MESKFPSRVLNPEPEDSKHAQKAIIGCIVLATAILAMIVGIDNSNEQKAAVVPEPVQTFDTLVSGASCPVPTPNVCTECPSCYLLAPIPSEEFVERALASAKKHGASADDIAWMRGRWKKESWNNPRIISRTGDVGLCQVNLTAHPEVDPIKLMTNPEYAGEVCYGIVEKIRVCGKWQHCCYRRGICGCQLWLKEEKGVDVNWRNDADCRRMR
jgi:hypothetical protein